MELLGWIGRIVAFVGIPLGVVLWAWQVPYMHEVLTRHASDSQRPPR